MTSLFSLSFLATLWTNSTMLAQVDTDVQTTAAAAPSPMVMVLSLLCAVLMIAAMWKVFTKAGQPGWASIIPIYNWFIWCKIVGRPGWWVLLLFLCMPIFGIILCIDLAKSFGKGVGFALGLIFLPIIFLAILGFGSATYQGPSVAPKV